MRSRDWDGVAYDGGGPDRDEVRRVNDPHPGMHVVVSVGLFLRSQGERYFAFALHRYARGKSAESFPDGELIEAKLLGEKIDRQMMLRCMDQRERARQKAARHRERERLKQVA